MTDTMTKKPKLRRNKGQWVKGQSGNPNGRPTGSRNKSSLIKAQLKLDDGSEIAAKLLNAVMSGDPAALEEFGIKTDELALKLRIDAAKAVLGQTANGMKTLEEGKGEAKPSESEKPADNTPRFNRVAKLP